ncbi:helix-turn-helix domain-containing protein [Kribbella qitaiheensis]|uniref:helix-turn-helix domain-containing protein n=1 Tax=Kribbella qitaiheensis TaxID=1544730 RepID=UPI0019D4F9ED|nr:XRE family transcriptional regulator [Kribbella qitaiheensis]
MTISRTVGSNLRQHRRSRQLSLTDLAAAAGIGKTTLHALELGEGNPTLSTLWALAAALEVPLGALLEDEPQPVTVVRAAEGPRVDGDSVHARLLHRLNVRGSVEVYELALDQTQQLSEAHLPGVQECLVVTRGRVKAGPADAPVDLAAGDSVHHQAAQPHVYEGLADDNQALLLMIYDS